MASTVDCRGPERDVVVAGLSEAAGCGFLAREGRNRLLRFAAEQRCALRLGVWRRWSTLGWIRLGWMDTPKLWQDEATVPRIRPRDAPEFGPQFDRVGAFPAQFWGTFTELEVGCASVP